MFIISLPKIAFSKAHTHTQFPPISLPTTILQFETFADYFSINYSPEVCVCVCVHVHNFIIP